MRISSMLLKVILALVVIIAISSCTKPGNTTVAQSNVDYYTCTMHPSVHSKTPGKCPICSMDLVPVLKKVANDTGAKDNSGKSTPGAITDNDSTGSLSMASANQPPGNKPGEFSVPVERQQQIGVTYASAERRPIQLSIRSVGVLEPDQAKIFEYVARVDGYIQDLKVTSPGQEVNAGEPLVTIYSPDLRSTEQELVNLLNERDRGGSRASLDQVIESSKQRLRQWNVRPEDQRAREEPESCRDPRSAMPVFGRRRGRANETRDERQNGRSPFGSDGSIPIMALGRFLRERSGTPESRTKVGHFVPSVPWQEV